MVKHIQQDDSDSEEIRLQEKLIAESKNMLNKKLDRMEDSSESDNDDTAVTKSPTANAFVKTKVKIPVSSSSDESSDSDAVPKIMKKPTKKKSPMPGDEDELRKREEALLNELKKISMLRQRKRTESEESQKPQKAKKSKDKFSKLSTKKADTSSDSDNKTTPIAKKLPKDGSSKLSTKKADTSSDSDNKTTPTVKKSTKDRMSIVKGTPLQTSTPNIRNSLMEAAKLSAKKEVLHKVLMNSDQTVQSILKQNAKNQSDNEDVSESEELFPCNQTEYILKERRLSAKKSSGSDSDVDAKKKVAMKNVSFDIAASKSISPHKLSFSKMNELKKAVQGILKTSAHDKDASDSYSEDDNPPKTTKQTPPKTAKQESESSSEDEPPAKTAKQETESSSEDEPPAKTAKQETESSSEDEPPAKTAKQETKSCSKDDRPPKTAKRETESSSEDETPQNKPKVLTKADIHRKPTPAKESSSDDDSNGYSPTPTSHFSPNRINEKLIKNIANNNISESDTDGENMELKLSIANVSDNTPTVKATKNGVKNKRTPTIAEKKKTQFKNSMKLNPALKDDFSSDSDLDKSKIVTPKTNNMLRKSGQTIPVVKPSKAPKKKKEATSDSSDNETHNSAKVISAVLTPKKETILSDSGSDLEISPIKKLSQPKQQPKVVKNVNGASSDSEDDLGTPEVINKPVKEAKLDVLNRDSDDTSDDSSDSDKKPAPKVTKNKKRKGDSDNENMSMSQTIRSWKSPDVVDTSTKFNNESFGDVYNCLKQYILSNSNLNKISIQTDFVLKSLKPDDEVWVMQCPNEIPVSEFAGCKLKLGGKTKLKINSQKYECQSEYSEEKDITLLGSAAKKNPTLAAKTIKPVGTISIHRLLKQSKPVELKASDKSAVNLPNNLKVRHPIFGVDYEKKIDICDLTLQKLIDAEVIRRKYDKKKGRKKSKDASDADITKNEMIFQLLNDVQHVDDSAPTKKKKRVSQPVDDVLKLEPECKEVKKKKKKSVPDSTLDTSAVEFSEETVKKKKKKSVPDNTLDTSAMEFSEETVKKKKKKRRNSEVETLDISDISVKKKKNKTDKSLLEDVTPKEKKRKKSKDQ